MDLVQEFFRGKSVPRLLMIAALIILFVSQFFFYFDDPTTGFLSIDADWNTTGYYWFGTEGTGWDLHPHAYVILVVLAFALLRDDIAEHRLFLRVGYWTCLLLMFAAMSPGAPMRAFGAGLGGIAFLMALVATVWHQFSRPALDSPAGQPPSEG